MESLQTKKENDLLMLIVNGGPIMGYLLLLKLIQLLGEPCHMFHPFLNDLDLNPKSKKKRKKKKNQFQISMYTIKQKRRNVQNHKEREARVEKGRIGLHLL